MDRPTSIGGHRRNASAVPPRKGSSIPSHHGKVPSQDLTSVRPSTPSGPGAISLFVANLRLLDLDLLPDWPGITVASLGNQDARTRIRGTEFALFQLFKLYDPMTTAEKLQPFFPPLEPLQSINLRAALFRCLTDLKKNGIMAKDAIIRKSMLDECQGDKFWEICLVFSSIVMKKNALRMRTTYGIPLAEQIGTAESLSRLEKDSMLPLSIAHRASLAKLLETKQKKDDALGKLYKVLADKGTDLQRRKARAQEESKKRSAHGATDKARNVEQNLRKNWIGANGNLRETLIYGDDTSHKDVIFSVPFEDVWSGKTPDLLGEGRTEIGLLEGLEVRANRQTQRLRKWQNMHEQMIASKPKAARYSMLAAPSTTVSLQFDRHRNLSARDPPELDEGPPEIKKNPSTTPYDDILTAMREELRQNRLRPKPEAAPVIHRANTTPVNPNRKTDLQPDTHMPGAEHQRSPSQTAVPFRPMFGRRVPSRSRSYQQPKLESQRQPIPLKSELFSPLKNMRASPSSNADGGSYVSSPLQQDPSSPSSSIAAESPYDSKRVSQSSEAEGTVDSGVGLGMDEGVTTPRARPGSTSSDVFARPSLVERTRKSVAFTSSDQMNGFLPDAARLQSETEPAKSDKRNAPVVEAIPCALDRHGSLLERTRQSISLAPTPSQHRPALRKHSPTRSYPVNQFETPQKQSRDITPRETLFSPDAEYESVFKSRPKIRIASPHIDSKRVSLEENEN